MKSIIIKWANLSTYGFPVSYLTTTIISFIRNNTQIILLATQFLGTPKRLSNIIWLLLYCYYTTSRGRATLAVNMNKLLSSRNRWSTWYLNSFVNYFIINFKHSHTHRRREQLISKVMISYGEMLIRRIIWISCVARGTYFHILYFKIQSIIRIQGINLILEHVSGFTLAIIDRRVTSYISTFMKCHRWRIHTYVHILYGIHFPMGIHCEQPF